MGRPGSALDNAVIESWHSTLEFELRSLEKFATRARRRTRVAAWIEDYNHIRRHSALGMIARPWITSRPAGRPRDRGGRRGPGTGRRLRRRSPWCARRVRGRPSGLQGAAHRCATALRAALDPGDLCGPSGAKRAGQACPARKRRTSIITKSEVSTVSGDCHLPLRHLSVLRVGSRGWLVSEAAAAG